ncbi:MAG TPA: N-acetylmuramoyl-L-alanine amidase, partial [Paracoccaceae bacterium]|nr:N-acetylmuramoyl-L-alanine amidase [Paracoccaceae bacterium]
SDGSARLTVRLVPANALDFADASGAPPDPGWDLLVATDVTQSALPAVDDGILTVAIDPGHGGVDPGAERDGIVEAEVMLILARELAEAINRTEGMRAVLTRDGDTFVALEERMTQARLAGADVMISLHADALDEDETHGASVYTLDAEAQDAASARMAERHDRGDLVAGLDLKGHDDTVATVLMDLARQETAPMSDRLADGIVTALGEVGAELNSRPRRKAELAVLNAADFASVLVEVGFLSNADDRAALSVQPGRATIIRGLVLALQRWAVDEAARALLLRK